MTCSVLDCDDPVVGRGLCNKHYLRMRRTGNTDKTVLSGTAHYNWKTDDEVTYARTHQRLAKALGPASQHLCQNDCGRQAQQWAYDHGDPDERTAWEGPYSVNFDYYVALCIPCHRKMDDDKAVP
jgi:hypothetical protein